MNLPWNQAICPTGTGCDMATQGWLTDLWSTGAGAAGLNGTAFIEYLFRDRLLAIVDGHDLDRDGPLYIQYTPHVTHWPLQVPQEWYDAVGPTTDDEAACGDDFPWVWPGAPRSVIACRRQYLALVALMDSVVGNVTAAMKAKGWWPDTLMIMSSDNGGSTSPDESAGTNYPLRGGKYAPGEGGIRVASFVSGGYLPAAVRGTRLDAPVHISDWYGTLCGLVGVDPTDARAAAAGLPPVDSLDVWPLVSGANGTSPHTVIPVGPDVLLDFTSPPAIWKLIRGNQAQYFGWQGPLYPNSTSPDHNPRDVGLNCSAGGGCLFDVAADPTEHDDVAAANPGVVAALGAKLAALAAGFYSNSDVLTPDCPANVTGDCMCWLAANRYGGYLGPWAH
jgi:arylsulfatase B